MEAKEKRKTALDWFTERITDMIHESNHSELSDLFQEAKLLEQNQIIDAYAQGFIESNKMDKGAADYYNSIYKL
jgi:hypothetical protein